jgi:hypothetical protein
MPCDDDLTPASLARLMCQVNSDESDGSMRAFRIAVQMSAKLWPTLTPEQQALYPAIGRFAKLAHAVVSPDAGESLGELPTRRK